MYFKKQLPEKIIPMFLIGILIMLTGCATPATPEQRIEKQKNVSIYQYLGYNTLFKNSQDNNGNYVAYQSDSYMRDSEYKSPRIELQKYSDNCIANGGIFDIEKKGKNNIDNAMSAANSASWGQARSTYEFWNQLGINGTAEAMNVFQRQWTARTNMVKSLAFIFDSAVRTENVGTFICLNAATSEVKWRINRDLYNVKKGYRSPSGMYDFPEAYTVYVTETVVIYEKRAYKVTNTGYTKLPERSESLIYPISGYYVVIEPSSSGWKVLSTTHFRSPAGKNSTTLALAPKRTNEKQEIVILSDDGNFAAPAYKDKSVNFEYSEGDLGRNKCHIDEISNRLNYSICTSAFGDTPREYGTTAKFFSTIFADRNIEYNMKLSRSISFLPQNFWAALDQANIRDALTQYSSNTNLKINQGLR